MGNSRVSLFWLRKCKKAVCSSRDENGAGGSPFQFPVSHPEGCRVLRPAVERLRELLDPGCNGRSLGWISGRHSSGREIYLRTWPNSPSWPTRRFAAVPLVFSTSTRAVARASSYWTDPAYPSCSARMYRQRWPTLYAPRMKSCRIHSSTRCACCPIRREWRCCGLMADHAMSPPELMAR